LPKKYPPLTPKEVIAILGARAFDLDDTVGSHAQYIAIVKGMKRKVTVDLTEVEYDDYLLKSMISQSGLSREEFYCSTKRSAVKIGLKVDPSL